MIDDVSCLIPDSAGMSWWFQISSFLIASRKEGARASNLLQREGDTRRILLEWEEAQRRQKQSRPVAALICATTSATYQNISAESGS